VKWGGCIQAKGSKFSGIKRRTWEEEKGCRLIKGEKCGNSRKGTCKKEGKKGAVEKIGVTSTDQIPGEMSLNPAK